MSTDAPESPLQIIRAKEQAIARQIEAAREKAAVRIQNAEAQAEVLRSQADRTAAAEAQSMLEDAICEAETQGEAIRQAAENDAVDLRERGRSAIQQAANLIVARVLPIAVRVEERDGEFAKGQ
jgi:vacuolar-type H+-ATPase subunit H